MTINPEIFLSVLAALSVYGLSKNVIALVLGRLWGKQVQGATNQVVGRKAA